MENTVRSRLQSLQFGAVQTHRGVSVLPLKAQPDGIVDFVTLGEALDAKALVVTEVSQEGSVPELLVANTGRKPVLLLDGEELAGAKQNRVLNTSILLKEQEKTKIPVSCTEQGRWRATSANFKESGNMLHYQSRARKSRSVHQSLESTGKHESNQAEVWAGIAQFQVEASAPSPTSAMSDVYKAWEEDLRECDRIFQPVADQVGLMVFLDGVPAGLDCVSRTEAYARLHSKLVQSYAMEGLISQKQTELTPEQILTRAKSFLEEIIATEERRFPTIGCGTDFRYKAKGMAGAALVHESDVIHCAFFSLAEEGRPANMSSFKQRRRHYSE